MAEPRVSCVRALATLALAVGLAAGCAAARKPVKISVPSTPEIARGGLRIGLLADTQLQTARVAACTPGVPGHNPAVDRIKDVACRPLASEYLARRALGILLADLAR